ncbi:MAG TPA: hypothetical protein VFK57_09055 [Vicinamibacterales bacterium]|nr:hypothetical protein [Vicinamibacterales bacterium]
MKSRIFTVACGLSLIALGGCQTSKSSTPTAPTVAGPIPGVTISAPALLEPAQGFKFKESEQPIRLVVQNATTNGVRPLTYTFEVASDANFTTKVFSRSNVEPGDGRTSVQVDRLEIGRAYYWRAWAQDGANTGAMATAGFEIYPKPAVSAPAPVAPINNELLTTTTPSIRVNNSTYVGPVGHLGYEFQVASDQAFTRLVAAGIVASGATQTTFNSSPLPNGATMYWRSRASDGETTSPWSPTQTFRTPAPPAPAPTPPPTPPPGGGASCALGNGPAIVNCIAAKYADKRRPVGSLGERQNNMMFLRDRIIEAGICSGLVYGHNLKRGGPELSIDVIAWQRPDGNMGVDIAFDYDNIGTTLQLTWGEIDLFAKIQKYPSFSCSGV